MISSLRRAGATDLTRKLLWKLFFSSLEKSVTQQCIAVNWIRRRAMIYFGTRIK
jgi:hypothetical protein